MGNTECRINPEWVKIHHYEIVADETDSIYGRYQIIRFPQIESQFSFFLKKTIDPQEFEVFCQSNDRLQRRIARNSPLVMKIDCLGECPTNPRFYDLYYQHTPTNISEIFRNRKLKEIEIWHIFDAVVTTGQFYEQNLEHFPRIQKSMILIGSNQINFMSPHVSEVYLKNDLPFYIYPSPESQNVHKNNIKRNIMELGLVLLSLASNKKEDEFTTKEQVIYSIDSLKQHFSIKLISIIEAVLLHGSIHTFNDLRSFANHIQPPPQKIVPPTSIPFGSAGRGSTYKQQQPVPVNRISLVNRPSYGNQINSSLNNSGKKERSRNRIFDEDVADELADKQKKKPIQEQAISSDVFSPFEIQEPAITNSTPQESPKSPIKEEDVIREPSSFHVEDRLFSSPEKGSNNESGQRGASIKSPPKKPKGDSVGPEQEPPVEESTENTEQKDMSPYKIATSPIKSPEKLESPISPKNKEPEIEEPQLIDPNEELKKLNFNSFPQRVKT